VVTEIATFTALWEASSERRSRFRTTRKFFVITITGFLNSVSTSRQTRVTLRRSGTLDGLVGVRDPRECQELGLPSGEGEFVSQEFRRFLLDEDLRFEIEVGGYTEVLVGGTGVTIGAAVLASPVRVDAQVESDVETRVAGHNRSRGILEKLCSLGRVLPPRLMGRARA
jgi:hypothetical protein